LGIGFLSVVGLGLLGRKRADQHRVIGRELDPCFGKVLLRFVSFALEALGKTE
jgi:hypothetical protein